MFFFILIFGRADSRGIIAPVGEVNSLDIVVRLRRRGHRSGRLPEFSQSHQCDRHGLFCSYRPGSLVGQDVHPVIEQLSGAALRDIAQLAVVHGSEFETAGPAKRYEEMSEVELFGVGKGRRKRHPAL